MTHPGRIGHNALDGQPMKRDIVLRRRSWGEERTGKSTAGRAGWLVRLELIM